MRNRFSRSVEIIGLFLVLLFWPLNFLFHNPITDTIHFFLPSILLFVTLTLFKDFIYGKNILQLCIPLINTSLFLTPVLALIGSRNKWSYFLVGLIMTLTLFIAWKPFLGSSIFYYERNDEQKIIRQGYLYPTIWLSRAFQNKPSIYIDRFSTNFFALVDLNNYFFGFHPRQIAVQNQNLQKFPFVSSVFLLGGLYWTIRKNRALLISIGIVIFNLSLLKNFDKTDAILWLPITLLVAIGFKIFIQSKIRFKSIGLLVFFIFSLVEYIQLIINFLINK